jgi:hypothetical protein
MPATWSGINDRRRPPRCTIGHESVPCTLQSYPLALPGPYWLRNPQPDLSTACMYCTPVAEDHVRHSLDGSR